MLIKDLEEKLDELIAADYINTETEQHNQLQIDTLLRRVRHRCPCGQMESSDCAGECK